MTRREEEQRLYDIIKRVAQLTAEGKVRWESDDVEAFATKLEPDGELWVSRRTNMTGPDEYRAGISFGLEEGREIDLVRNEGDGESSALEELWNLVDDQLYGMKDKLTEIERRLGLVTES